jgi:predicted Zn-dependent protease
MLRAETGGGVTATAAAAAATDRLLTGTIDRSGTGLSARVIVLDRAGKIVDGFVVRSSDGDVRGLAQNIAEAAAEILQIDALGHPAASTGQLRPFVRAAAALANGDAAAAAGELLAADARVSGPVTAARAIARQVVTAPAVPAGVRMHAALVGVDTKAVLAIADAELARDASSAVGRAGRAHARLTSLDLDGAEAALAGVTAKDPFVQLARVELLTRRGDTAARNRVLASLLADEPYLPALVFAAGLPPGELGPKLEGNALAAAERVAGRHPRLASALGLRAARGGQVKRARALELIAVVDLDEAEVKALGPIADAAVADGLPVGYRLRAELALRAGDDTRAATDVDELLALRPGDRLGTRYLGRLRLAGGDAAGAAEAFAAAAAQGDRDGRREQARALALAGDETRARALLLTLAEETPTSETLAAQAALLLDQQDVDGAIARLEQAVNLSPADPALTRQLARAYELGGRNTDAARARTQAEALERLGARATGIGASGTALQATRAALAGPAIAPLVGELRRLLEAFPALLDPGIPVVLLVPLGGAEAAFYNPYHVVPATLGMGLAQALAATPYRVKVLTETTGTRLAEPLDKRQLEALADTTGANAILLYGLRARVGTKLGRAEVRLILYDVARKEALETVDVVDGRSLGLLRWNHEFLALAGAIAAALAAWLGLWLLRGRGEIQVRIKSDPATDHELFTLTVTHKSARPVITDAQAHNRKYESAGHSASRFVVHLPGPSTRMHAIPSGHWFVHLHGTFRKALDPRILGESFSAKVQVRRGKTTYVEFDLEPKHAEYRVSVFDGESACEHAEVWVDDGWADRVRSNHDGLCEVLIPRGKHLLHVHAAGMKIARGVTVHDTKVRTVTVNLARERKLAEVSDGIALEPEEWPAITAPGVRPGAVTGRSAAPAAPAERATVSIAATLAQGSAPAVDAEGSRPSGPASAKAAPAQTGAAALVGLRRYQAQRELGRGAMGVVFHARDLVLERDVALKIVSEAMRSHPQALGLFLREAKALAQLNHPNVVAVYDQGQDGDDTYMVMEFVDGRTLEDILRQRSLLPLAQALNVADQLCAGLAYAHSRKVIHRDIKPGNIFVARGGVVKLGDFGLARVLHELAIQQTEIRGTPLYMAPEQVRGADIDFRADLYAVGCTMFELVTGRPPFVEGEILYHHIHTEPPRPADLADIPPELDRLILACIAKDKERRIASAEAIREALRPLRQRYG